MTTILDTPAGITRFTMLSQYHAAKLHLLGMRHSSGRSIIAHIKRTYHLHGSNESVVRQFRELIDGMEG